MDCFNISVRNEVDVCQDNVGYLSTTSAPATNMSTVHEVLVRSLKIKDALQLKSIVVVLDQALYVKVAEIVWKQPDVCNSIRCALCYLFWGSALEMLAYATSVFSLG